MERRSKAHAKLNLSLRVLAREESGYHSIETLLLNLELADRVTVRATGADISLTVSGDPSVPADDRNLAWQAARSLGAGQGGFGVHIELDKRIPSAAGLGGGSADAAAVLEAINALKEEPLSRQELVRRAGVLGSDVPFGLCSSRMAFAWERGRRMIPLRPPPPRPVLVLVPGFPIAASEAYGWMVDDRAAVGMPRPPPAVLPAPEEYSDWSTLTTIAGNDLEGPVFERRPILRSLRDDLLEGGAVLSMLCGSGSCVAGIFERGEDMDAVAQAAGGREGIDALRTRTLGPEDRLPG